MKTQNAKLNFKKDSIVELNEGQLNDVNGGTSAPCGAAAAAVSSGWCFVATVVLAAGAYVLNELDED